MASNQIPQALDKLISLGEDAAGGAQAQGPTIGLAQNTDAKIRANLTALTGDDAAVPPLPGSMALYDAAKAAKVLAKGAENAAEQAGRDFIAAAIGSLKPRLGTQWNSAWNAAGFTNGSLAIPADPLPALLSLRSHYIANPSHEVVSADGLINIGATAADTNATAVTIARSAYNAAETDAATRKATRDADQKALYQRLTGLRAELDQLLGDDDPAWYAFGFARPADGDSPGPVSTLGLAPGGAGILIATWTQAIRADRYRVFKKVIGTDPDPVQVASDVEGLTFTLLGLPTGASVEVFIVPANATGDGPASPTVLAVVP